MTTTDVLARALKSIGHHVAYVLGAGGFDPSADLPFTTPEHGCDCSGFAMWALGKERQVGGIWYGTDAIVADANGSGLLFFAVPYADARSGDLIVYPHQKPGHHGHVGVISVVDGGKPARVVHCSMGNWKAFGDAIAETQAALWLNVANTVVARPKFIEAA